ncbi:MAG: UDP-N-acetylmuramoyl-L-alanyl-D-glutamate--2,6-diaminopimelate ligase [Clostridia bacterium]|nr:UDP-N-acetylmuramoyl-L-alanyl-D-glutamate--2,6-diaminopimelate ligase [Clostridia bacterium]
MQFSHIIRPEEILFPKIPFDAEIGIPQSDFRKLKPGDIFFCEDGFHESGFSYVANAPEKGALAVIAPPGGAERIGNIPIPVFEVENVRKSYALAWSRYEKNPADGLRLIAITGTNGKTSVSSFLHTLLSASGISAGLIGTVEYTSGESHCPSSYTTPPPDVLYPMLREMKNKGITTVVMEASSHAIAQQRLYGLQFETAVFTGLSRDHLDYHKTWEAYRDTKASLFKQAKNALIYHNDAQAEYMGFSATGSVYYYGRNPEADFHIRLPQCDSGGIRYTLHSEKDVLPVFVPVIGNFHIENSAAAIACAYLEGLDGKTISQAVKQLHSPTGRMEKLDLPTDFSVYIDYAHSPDAMKMALTSLRPLTKKLTVLFGAGGDRDRGKRPEMGAVAEELADLVILTDDNPRNESPCDILDDIERGMKKTNHVRIENREKAIIRALNQAEKGEILLLAGKGHENYSIDKNGKHAFSEKEIIKKWATAIR